MLDIILTPAWHAGLRQVFLRVEVHRVGLCPVLFALARRVLLVLARAARDVAQKNK